MAAADNQPLLHVTVRQDGVKLGPANARRKCCGSCACRTTTDTEPSYDVAELAFDGDEFHCHQGMDPEVALDCVQWTYRADGTPLKADGSPAELCAGWWAYRRHALREQAAAARPDVA